MTGMRSLCAAITAVALTFLGGCARTNAAEPASAAEPADRVEPPRMVQRGEMPDLRIYNIPASGRAALRLQIEVLIDSRGQPDMKTLKITGPGSPENRMAIERWIAQAMFQPARRNGVPVSGIYRTSLAVRIRRTPG